MFRCDRQLLFKFTSHSCITIEVVLFKTFQNKQKTRKQPERKQWCDASGYSSGSDGKLDGNCNLFTDLLRKHLFKIVHQRNCSIRRRSFLVFRWNQKWGAESYWVMSQQTWQHVSKLFFCIKRQFFFPGICSISSLVNSWNIRDETKRDRSAVKVGWWFGTQNFGKTSGLKTWYNHIDYIYLFVFVCLIFGDVSTQHSP